MTRWKSYWQILIDTHYLIFLCSLFPKVFQNLMNPNSHQANHSTKWPFSNTAFNGIYFRFQHFWLKHASFDASLTNRRTTDHQPTSQSINATCSQDLPTSNGGEICWTDFYLNLLSRWWCLVFIKCCTKYSGQVWQLWGTVEWIWNEFVCRCITGNRAESSWWQ